MEALPEVASLPNPQDHVQLVVSAFADLLERKNADDSPDTSLVRGTRHIAMTHVDTYGNEMFTEAIEGLSMNRGESESLQNVSFLTDLDQNEWEEIDSANALSSEEQAIEKSGPQNAKESYDIRGRAGFFSKNKASSSSLNLAGPLVYPKEFSQPKSQLSMKAQAEADVAEIAKTIEKNGVSHATHSNSRGLPGGLAFTHKEAKTYFGNEARADFFARSKWLQTQRQNNGTTPSEAITMIVYPDSFLGSPPLVSEVWDASKEHRSTGDADKGPRAAVPNGLPAAGGLLSPVHQRDEKGTVGQPTAPPKFGSSWKQEHADGKQGNKSATSAAASKGHAKTAGPGGRLRRMSELNRDGGPMKLTVPNAASGAAGTDVQAPINEEEEQEEEEVVERQQEEASVAIKKATKAAPENFTLTISRTDPRARHKTATSELVSDFPFAPVRTVPELRVHTKVIIRTQSLLQGEAYEQLKLVECPANLNVQSCESVGDKLGGGSRDRLPSDEVTYFARALVRGDGSPPVPINTAQSATSNTSGKQATGSEKSASLSSSSGVRRPSSTAQSSSHVRFEPTGGDSKAAGQAEDKAGVGSAAEQLLASSNDHTPHPNANPNANLNSSRSRAGVLDDLTSPPRSAQKHKSVHIDTTFHSGTAEDMGIGKNANINANNNAKQQRSPMSRQALRSLSPPTPKAVKGKFLYMPTVPRTPVSPDRTAEAAASKVRGSKHSIYGPSKYNKYSNALLPSLGGNKNKPAHGHGHGHGAHAHHVNAATGNTAIGDAILAKLNATARDLLVALDKEVEVSQTSTLQPEHAFKVLNLTGHHHAHHPTSHMAHVDQRAQEHAAHVRHADAVQAAAHSMHAVLLNTAALSSSGLPHPQQQPPHGSCPDHGPHSTNAPHSATGGTHPAAAQQQVQQQEQPLTPAKGPAPIDAEHKHKVPLTIEFSPSPSKPPTGQRKAYNAAASPAKIKKTSMNSPVKGSQSACTTPVSAHTPNLEKGVEVTYMSKESYLGEKLTKLQGYLKTAPTAVQDKYNLLQKELERKRLEGLNPVKALVAKLKPLSLELTPEAKREEEIRNYSFNKDPLSPLEGYYPSLERLDEKEVPVEEEEEEEETPRDAYAGRFGYSLESLQQASKVSVPPLQLVCVDHRDRRNRRVLVSGGGSGSGGISSGGDGGSVRESAKAAASAIGDNEEVGVKKTGSLFKYLEGKKDQFDFNGDISSDSEDEAIMDVHQVDPASPVSPLHHLHLAGSLLHPADSPQQDDSSLGSAGDSSVGGSSYTSYTSHSRHSRGTGTGSRKLHSKAKKKADGGASEGDISPRSKYIDSCIRQRLNPRASLILRKNFTKRLNLQHFGMGDEMAVLFAEAIVNVPYIEAINIADNNLNDPGLGPVINAIVHMTHLVDLDISYNTIGPVAALSLSNYLAEPTCPLRRLVLRRADVDDGECERFVTSLKTNKCLVELDLCENLIGTAENLNTVMPDLVTGGEALADLLRSEGCVLRSLKLGWNMIRLDGAADLCSSLIINTSLTYLDLSFNSLGSLGGMALGDALQENKVLRTLNVANNSIDSVACLTICAGVLENEALEHVVFDGNPIGEQGAKTLMLLPTMVGSRVRISATACNIGIRDANCNFDSTALVRKFNLDMSNPFDRAVSLLILYLVASHQTYIIGISEHYDPATKTKVDLGLTEKVVVDYQNKRLMKEQLDQIESLKIVQAAARDEESAMALFREIDADGSGELDENEFGNLLTCMGLSMSPEEVRECMSEYDVDNGGVIEMSEFTLFIRNQAKEAERKLKELTEFPIMCIGAEKEIKRYVPPRTGTLTLVVVDGFTQKETYRVLSASDRNYINEIARQSGDLLTMTTYGVQSYRIRFNEAMGVAETLLKENSNRVEILSRILPQMASAADARMVVAKLLNNSKTDIQKLRREIGFALKPMLGCMDGFYSLDLSNQMDKFCFNKLLEMGMTIAYRRAKKSRLGYGTLGDCSQKGNWSAFRNEIFNGKPVVVTTDFASPMPKSGRLEFDFVSEQRVGKDDFILNDVRLTNMLVRVFQILPDERDYVLNKLRRIKELCDKTLGGDAQTVYECPKERAAQIGDAMLLFYENLHKRQEQIDKFRTKEGIKVNMEFDPLTTLLTYQNVNQFLTIKSLKPPPPPPVVPEVPAVVTPSTRADSRPSRRGSAAVTTPASAAASSAVGTAASNDSGDDFFRPDDVAALSSRVESARAKTPTRAASRAATPAVRVLDSWDEVEALGGPSQHLIEGFEAEDPADGAEGSRPTTQGENTAAAAHMHDAFNAAETGIKLDEYMRRYVCVMASSNVQPQAKAARTLELLVNTFEYHFIYARHLELMCEIFEEFGQIPCSEYFGTYRVELVISLFACVVDLHNFEIVMRRLTPFEAGCVTCRLGWLHLYNPMKPEGAYQLDLTRREERIIVKTLAQLATAEPGDNLPFVSFRWERDMASMPGYELTEPWLTEEGLPKKGIWDVVYYAGEGKLKLGCKPLPKLRRSLLQLVFLEEADIMSEQDKEEGKVPVLQGEGFMMANLGIWYNYLAYNEELAKQYKKGNAADKKKKK